MKKQVFRNVAVALFTVSFLAAQPADDTQLKQVIVFGRHSVRAPIAPNSSLDVFAAQPFPVFSVPTGYLTINGAALEKNLGGYYRYKTRLTFQAGIEIQATGSEFSDNLSTLSEKTFNFIPSVLYYF